MSCRAVDGFAVSAQAPVVGFQLDRLKGMEADTAGSRAEQGIETKNQCGCTYSNHDTRDSFLHE